MSAGPAINPGTVQAHLLELYGKGKLHGLKKIRSRGWLLHAPCAIRDVRKAAGDVQFALDGWGDKEYRVLVAGGSVRPKNVAILAHGNDQWQQIDPSRLDTHAADEYTVMRMESACRVRVR